MLLKEEVELLRRLPMFAQVDPTRLKLLAFTSNRLQFEPGQALFHQGDAGDAAYVVISGDADVLITSGTDEIKIAAVQRNSIVGEIAILCDVPRTATVRAVTRLDTLKINKENFRRLLREFPEVGIEVMRVLASRLNSTTAELIHSRRDLAKMKQ
jgi:CRP-like cAMP-binding protein